MWMMHHAQNSRTGSTSEYNLSRHFSSRTTRSGHRRFLSNIPPWMHCRHNSQTGVTSECNFSRHFSSRPGCSGHRGALWNNPPHVVQQRRGVRSVKAEEEEVSVEEMKRVLAQQDMRLDQGFTCFVTRCPRLGNGSRKAKATADSDHLYINMTTGHFLCQHCSKRGGWHDLQDNIASLSSLPQRRRKEFECFNDLDSVQTADRGSQQAEKLWESAMPIKSCATEVLAQIQENFDIHEIQASTLEAYGVRFDLATNSLLFPAHNGGGRLIGVHRLTCTIPEENDNVRVVQGSLLPKSGVLGLFGLNTLTKDVKEVVLTCSEWDAMAVYQETKAPALTLPAGISALPQELLPLLERFSKLILWFGDDVRSWEGAKLFAKKLNDKRCCIIRPSVEDPSPLEALRRGLKLSAVLNKARLVKHKSIVSFAELRQEIFSELTHTDQVAGVKWKRYTALNRLLKGHRRGELTVFTGPTGSGKTTFISDYSLDLCMQGVNTLWGSFEINNVRLGKMMLTQFAQTNLSKRLEDFDDWASRFEELPMYFMTFFGQESIRKVIEAMAHAVYVHDIAHVIVDNLQFMMGSDGEWSDRFAKQDSFITAFRKFATNMNCHVTLVIHPRKEKDSEDLTTASVFGSAKATQEADNVLILQDKRLSSVRGRKYLQITKNRFDGELGVMLLKFDKDSLGFAIREKPARRAAKDDSSAVVEESAPGNVPLSEDSGFPPEEEA
ncbi:hypothetical protein ACOMHN_038975 [Nucella lapillus]